MGSSSPTAGPGGRQGGQGFADLRARVISGVVLGAVGLALTLAGALPFALLVAAAAAVMAWEWGRIVRAGEGETLLAVHAVAVLLAIAFAAFGQPGAALAVLIAGTLAVFALAAEPSKLYSALGVLYVGLPCAALVWFRADPTLGLAAVLFMLVVAFTTDTAAFFAGRTLGGPKLWPRVSPNKTWSGFLGGIGTATLAAALFARVAGTGSPGRLALVGLLLGIVSQGGDLLESSLKRKFGVKDASALIPGHGGALDRLDSIAAVAVIAALYAALAGALTPARTLLVGP